MAKKIVLLAVLVAGGGALFWSLLPKPVEPELVHFKATPPPRTPIEDPEAKPRPLRIFFDQSVAPISLVGKETTSGFSIHPRTEGIWTWIDDKQLEFQPRSDWSFTARKSNRYEASHYPLFPSRSCGNSAAALRDSSASFGE